MHKFFTFFIVLLFFLSASSQTPKTYTSSEILLQLKKLNVLGSVLYIAAHPDDENTRLLAYLANEKLYRTGYLSLTRGDGGQNLIGDEQGIDLGLIRTQELLAARRIDGAEQFFSRAYDFGFCKSPEEALATWGHDKILSDAVWVIRKFRPDVIICRFPEDARAGHGHHAASGIIAREAFDAAADPNKFPEQLKGVVTVWQAKRMLWNTFNFGNTNTQNENQFKLDVGMYNPLLGKSYGEIAALSRSQHKSQGFGVPAQRGAVIEYFETIRGDKPVNDLMDGVDVSWRRQPVTFDKIKRGAVNINNEDSSAIIYLKDFLKGYDFKKNIDSIITHFSFEQPEKSLPGLIKLLKKLEAASIVNHGWFSNKLDETNNLIKMCSGIFLEANVPEQLNTIGDSIKVTITINNRLGLEIENAFVSAFGKSVVFDSMPKNQNKIKVIAASLPSSANTKQPYWLEKTKDNGSFTVDDQFMIGKPQSDSYSAMFRLKFDSQYVDFDIPVVYKHTDPVKGEIYNPVQLINPVFLNVEPSLIILKNDEKSQKKNIQYTLQSNIAIHDKMKLSSVNAKKITIFDSVVTFVKGEKRKFNFTINGDSVKNNSSQYIGGEISSPSLFQNEYFSLKKISYDHIPDIFYNYYDATQVIKMDLKIAGSSIGYIAGAGDKVPQALEQMGYRVTMLKEADINIVRLKQFDAIVTGIRAYNTNEWMNNVYEPLMQYVNEGGVLVVQYNTSSQIGPVKAKIAPYPFNITRNRITDENAKVNFLLPDHPALNYPNKITDKDFEGWIQERSIYNTEQADSNYQRILSMTDVGETTAQDGSLIVANYGKGKFVYTGLVFFRELPAGVPGAYRLFANLLAPPPPPAALKNGKSSAGKLPKPAKLKGKTGAQ